MSNKEIDANKKIENKNTDNILADLKEDENKENN